MPSNWQLALCPDRDANRMNNSHHEKLFPNPILQKVMQGWSAQVWEWSPKFLRT